MRTTGTGAFTRFAVAVVLCAGLSLAGAVGALGPGSRPADAATPVRIMPLGDSITWGTGASPTCHRTLTCTGYRAALRAKLAARGAAVDFVGDAATGAFGDPEHSGHPGWTIDQLHHGNTRSTATAAAGAVADWVRAADPDVILLHIGTNDLKYDAHRYRRPVRDRILREQALAPQRLSRLIDHLRRLRPRATVVVARIVPSRQVSVDRNVARYNARIPAVVRAKRTSRVRLADMSGLNPLTDLADVLHPNARGYAVMAHRWYRALEPLLRRGPAAARWPDTGNPERRRNRCAATEVRLVDRRDVLYGQGCRWWHHQRVPTRVAGRTVPRWTWRTLRTRRVATHVHTPRGVVVRYRTVRYWSAV
ncbi:MAG TPA: SGNH/GDSL hydrolase family protein [Pilimelia sp.]|nr:SGNH/GDSL hydrolase family protein [Pilimelia sp.]